MNQSYIYLSDDELLVIDEKGNVNKRNTENNMHDILLLENDIEKINEKIKELECKIENDEKNKLTKKEKILFYMLPFIFLTLPFSVVCLIFYAKAFFPSLIGLGMGSALIDMFLLLDYNDHLKKMNGIKFELSKAYDLKTDFQEKLDKIKFKSLVKDELKIKNKVVTLEDSSNLYKLANKQLEDSYEKGYKQKVKSLKLKR